MDSRMSWMKKLKGKRERDFVCGVSLILDSVLAAFLVCVSLSHTVMYDIFLPAKGIKRL